MVSTVSPKAKLTPRNPMPSVGKPAASTALPQPANVSQKVPKNSAPRRRGISMIPPGRMIEEVALLSAPGHSAHSIVFKFFTDDWLFFGVAAAADGGRHVDEGDRHFEHATPFNLPTKAQPLRSK